MTTPPTPDAGVPSRQEQKLAETDRMGIIALRNDLLKGGAFPQTVEHVLELLTSRTLTIYHFAEQCRKKEDHIDTLTAQLAAANADGAMLADSVEDFIGAQGTAYEADQYLMLQGVLREYAARTGAR